MRLLLLFIFLPVNVLSQKNKENKVDNAFYQIPYKDGKIVYEKIYFIDSLNDKEKLFNAVKKAIIKNTNYKYSKIDEDRVLGNITAEISFEFIAKPGIARLVYNAYTILSIDIKENRYRLQLYNNVAKTKALGYDFDTSMENQFEAELKSIEEKKWKQERSVIITWHKILEIILTGFGGIVDKAITDDF